MIEEFIENAYDERLTLVRLSTLECRKMRADLIEAFKIIKGFEGIEEQLFFRRHQILEAIQ